MDLVVHPRETVTFEQFLELDPVAVALDGFVFGPSRWDRDQQFFSFNHHDGDARFTTRSTCEQVALALRAGAPVAGRGAHVHVNDDDPDVALSVFLLDHPDLVADPRLMALCTLQGVLDTYGGAAGVPSPEELAPLAWVVDPWASRFGGRRDATEMAEVIAEVCERVGAHVRGCSGVLDREWGYRRLCSTGKVWAVVEEHPLARARVCADGAEVFVSVRDACGVRTVTVGKASPFVDCDMVRVWERLNWLDRCDPADVDDRWGGGDLIGGSPRRSGTGLDLSAIVDTVRDVIAAG